MREREREREARLRLRLKELADEGGHVGQRLLAGVSAVLKPSRANS